MSAMAGPYRQILAVPGTARFEAAALAARMAHLMTVLSVFFFIPAVTGSYGRAGAVSGAYALAYSLGSPFVSRLAERAGKGQAELEQLIRQKPIAAVAVAGVAGFLLALLVRR